MRARWRPPPWFAPPAPRIRFVHGLAALGAVAAARSSTYPGGFQVDLTIHADGIESRQISIQFSPGTPDIPRVLVDGPPESPHRYSDNTLCMWYPDDPRECRWVPSDGSADLIVRIAAHLIREAWWRETGEWIGSEVPHGPVDHRNDPVGPRSQNDGD